MLSWKFGIAAIIAVALVGLVATLIVAPRSGQQSQGPGRSHLVGWVALPQEEQRPERFEPYLQEHPEDEDRRTAALIWYSRREKNSERLKHHTLEMIKHHPACMYVFFANVTLFYREPDYRERVIAELENQVRRGNADHKVHWVLAMACEQGALPRKFDDAESRRHFLRYFELPEDTNLLSKLDEKLAEKALRYYRLAIEGAEPQSKELYAKQAIRLLVSMGRPREGVEFARAMLVSVPTLKENASFLLAYGRSLSDAGEARQAVRMLKQVRRFDKEGQAGGPACATTRAEMLLGAIALDAGDRKDASQRLLASVDVQQCCHNMTKGIPLELAKRLLDVGEHAVVIQFCENVLENFTPNQPETKALLDRARKAAAAKP